MQTETTGVKIKTLLVPSKSRKKHSQPSGVVSTVMSNVAVTVATSANISNSVLVGLNVRFIAFVGFATWVGL